MATCLGTMSSSPPPSPSSISRRTSSAQHHYTDSPEQSEHSSPSSPGSHIPMALPMETLSGKSEYKLISGNESIIRFLLLPSQIFTVLLLEFFNSFRSFGLRFILYNYITNEYGISDTQAGVLLGIKGFVDIGFGLAGSILVDIVGVRRISLVALSVALIGRTLLAFGRTKATLYPALFLFSPCGDALLNTGLYAVALKKLTTPLTRPLAFAISYATFNLAGAFADVILDKMRAHADDYNVTWGVYTPMRQFVVLTWFVLVLTFAIAYGCLQDLSVIDPGDLDSDEIPQNNADDTVEDSDGIFNQRVPVVAVPSEPMVSLRTLKRWFPNQQMFHPEDEAERSPVPGNSLQVQSAPPRMPNYKVYKTNHSTEGLSSPAGSLRELFSQVMSILRLRNTWIVIIFGFLTMTVGMNWSASEIILPPFLERRFGESVPIYTIQSINLIMCLILPPFLASLTAHKENFEVILPGLWLMSVSPIFVAMSPNIPGACLWQVFMTLGEVLWSPRQDAWTADLAPTGKEGLFFAVSRARAFLSPLADFVLGSMNEKWNTNCGDCRDSYGHFCSANAENNEIQCTSLQEECEIFLDNLDQSCPSTCLECPTYEHPDPSSLWYVLMLVGILSPLSVWFCLPFLRGRHKREEQFYGILSVDKLRLFGICGAPGEHHSLTRSYDRFKAIPESYDSNEMNSLQPHHNMQTNQAELL